MGLFVCESLKYRKYPLREQPSSEEKDKAKEAFCRLSAQTISELIQEEPDTYTLKDVKWPSLGQR